MDLKFKMGPIVVAYAKHNSIISIVLQTATISCMTIATVEHVGCKPEMVRPL